MFSLSPSGAPLGENLPAKLKVYAPNGDTKEVVGWLGIRTHVQYTQLVELFLLLPSPPGCGTLPSPLGQSSQVEVLNKKVVVQNLDTGEVIYNPRYASMHHEGKSFMTASETVWLKENPAWPGVLELEDNPVSNGEEPEGIN